MKKYIILLLMISALDVSFCKDGITKDVNISIESNDLSRKMIKTNTVLLKKFGWDSFKNEFYKFEFVPRKEIYGGSSLPEMPYFAGVENDKYIFFVLAGEQKLDKNFHKNIYIYKIFSKNNKIDLYNCESGCETLLNTIIYIPNKISGLEFKYSKHSEPNLYNNNNEYKFKVLDSNFNIISEYKFDKTSKKSIKLNEMVIYKDSIIIPFENIKVTKNKVEKISNNFKKRELNYQFVNLFGNKEKFVITTREKESNKLCSLEEYIYGSDTNRLIELKNSKYYDFYGTDNKNRYYFADADNLKLRQVQADTFTDKIIAVDFDKKVEYTIRHEVPGLDKTKKDDFLLTDYQVREDGIIYCCYMHKDGVFILEIRPVW
jgi:hypothetical protein